MVKKICLIALKYNYLIGWGKLFHNEPEQFSASFPSGTNQKAVETNDPKINTPQKEAKYTGWLQI